MYPVDCERSEEHGSSAGGNLVTSAAVHGISVGLFVYVGRFSGPIYGLFFGGVSFFHRLEGKYAPPLEIRRFCSAPLCHS